MTQSTHQAGLPKVSFEFFPPATPEMKDILTASIKRLAPIAPQFVSVTYGADGSTRERTHEVIEHILSHSDLVPAAHLTCVGAPRAKVDEIIQSYWDLGVRHIVALRGDPPEGIGTKYRPHGQGYETTADLVAGIREIGDFEISVSAYPEKHPESANIDEDLDILQAKIDSGATRAITQFFFDNQAYFRYLEKAQARGIKIPIVPGIIPAVNFTRICDFAQKCNTRIPENLTQRFAGLEDEPDLRRLVAAATTAEQVNILRAQGVDQFHFYTMNRAELVYAICRILGLGPSIGEQSHG